MEERLALFEYAMRDYDDGLMFFYFSSSDLQSHILWWNSDADHPSRPTGAARSNFEHVRRLYQKLDTVIGDIVDRYGSQATIIVMSDHGFANFGRQFNLNTWLRDHGYLGPQDCTSIMDNVAWNQTTAYGLGLNGLYLNMKGRERDGIVEPGAQRETLLRELIGRPRGCRGCGRESDPRRLPRRQDLFGQCHRAGARPDYRLRPRLSRVLGHRFGRHHR